ncbi:hypothetical protein F8M41_015250 [Gigaspora margarita]|uniref:Uncharacterized protein n=1 Tax=Gigaspora margarita TaxID=4874 RepID=A0A8H3WXW6_GIGMA|nr:hypothetical protein F8M41_015250 [Gigaspora margarita]
MTYSKLAKVDYANRIKNPECCRTRIGVKQDIKENKSMVSIYYQKALKVKSTSRTYMIGFCHKKEDRDRDHTSGTNWMKLDKESRRKVECGRALSNGIRAKIDKDKRYNYQKLASTDHTDQVKDSENCYQVGIEVKRED